MIVTDTSHAQVALSVLPAPLVREIESLARARRGGLSSLSEIRIRARGASHLVFSSGQVRLLRHVTEGELYEILSKITDSSLFAHRDTISRGFVSMPRGVRVGVCGRARYDGGRAVVSEISSLVFRIPPPRCEIADELYSAYLSSKAGMLIFSPPGVGKTTALRFLARDVSRNSGKRIVVVDERCEFDSETYSELSVDILSGYSRAEGIALAVRSLGAELIMVDELMGDECAEIEYSLQSGIPIIATAHAGSLSELLSKRELAQLISRGVFSTFVGISRSGGGYNVKTFGESECLSI